MAIPEALYGSLLTIGAGAAVWGAKAFVQQQIRPQESPHAIPRSWEQLPLPPIQRPEAQLQDAMSHLSAKDCKDISDYIKAVLNGRYLLAREARRRFRRLEKDNRERFDQLQKELQELKLMMARHLRECDKDQG